MNMLDSNRDGDGLGSFVPLLLLNLFNLVFKRRDRVKSAPAQLPRFFIPLKRRGRIAVLFRYVAERGNRRAVRVIFRTLDLAKVRGRLIVLADFHVRTSQRKYHV